MGSFVVVTVGFLLLLSTLLHVRKRPLARSSFPSRPTTSLRSPGSICQRFMLSRSRRPCRGLSWVLWDRKHTKGHDARHISRLTAERWNQESQARAVYKSPITFRFMSVYYFPCTREHPWHCLFYLSVLPHIFKGRAATDHEPERSY